MNSRQRGRIGIAGLAATVVCACWALSSGRAQPAASAPAVGPRAESRNRYGYDSTADLTLFDPRYPELHRKAAAELKALQLEMVRQTLAGRATPVTRQIFLEARWLVFYSAQWDRIDRRLADLRAILAKPADPADGREQVEADGSFDHGSEAWFLKLDSTIEELGALRERGLKPKYPLKLLDEINSPEKLRAYLNSVLISDPRRTGIDSRFELNIAITNIERFIMGAMGDVHPFHPDLQRALLDYEDNHWQDPRTGYWGGWFQMPDGSIRKTADLSVTFHVASYRPQEGLRRIPEMMRTTLDFRDEEYPFGWLEEGVQSNHHNYDVARLFRIGWPQMAEPDRAIARQSMRRMIDFCLKETMNPDGSFKLMDEDTLGSSYYFPVSLLDELGYLRPSRKFWTDEEFPGHREVAARIAGKLRDLKLSDTESANALRRLDGAKDEADVTDLIDLAIVIGVPAGCLAAGIVAWRWWRRRGRAAGGVAQGS